ncbi:phosphatidate cytidylyltransferase [Rhodopirellula sp. SM50]|nr:phosphatidate cytidylyltransferase [Rhodopirellula sp. SM50]PAY18963.1 phosphatidate cytidylyltransferase [Rhodopirellula sp. SM50]
MNVISGSYANVLSLAMAVFSALLAGTLYRLSSLRRCPGETARRRVASLISWWLIAGSLFVAALGGRWAASSIWLAMSLIAMTEYRRLSAPTPSTTPSAASAMEWTPAARVMTVNLTVLYIGIAVGGGIAWLAFVSAASAIALCAATLTAAGVQQYTSRIAFSILGLLLCGIFPACSLLLLDPESPALFLLVVGMTQWNDILSAWAGRLLGRRKLAAVISPKKSLEGFVGGLIGTVVTAALLGPSLTELTTLDWSLLGLAIATAGTLGDLNMSAIKRAAGVKDSGTLIPGQGGMLDRIDSLTFSAPIALLLVEVMR